MSRAPFPTAPRRERVLVCGVLLPGRAAEVAGPLSELRALLEAAGAEPVGADVVQRKAEPHPATLMGRGKVAEVRAEVERQRPDAVAVDNDLTPAQIRNLEKAWGVRVLDRSEVILDIFARRARTRRCIDSLRRTISRLPSCATSPMSSSNRSGCNTPSCNKARICGLVSALM